MFTVKEKNSVTLAPSPIQVRLSVAGDRRFVALAQALSRTQVSLAREILENALDSVSPDQAQALLADYLNLNVWESGALWMSSDGIDIIPVGSIDTDGQYSPPDHWKEIFYDGGCDEVIEAIREELRRQIPAQEGWSWSDYPVSMLVVAFSPVLSVEGLDALCRIAEQEKLGNCDMEWEQVERLAESVASYPLATAWYCLRPDISDGESAARWGELDAQQQVEVMAAIEAADLSGVLVPR